MPHRVVPVLLLALSLAGIAHFSRGLSYVDTIALLACGAAAGASMAEFAAARRRRGR